MDILDGPDYLCKVVQCISKYIDVANLFKEEFEEMKLEKIFEEDEFLEWGGDWKRFKDIPHFQIVYK
jgi:hypothetical protein